MNKIFGDPAGPTVPIETLSRDNLYLAGRQLVEILPVATMTVPPYTTTNAIFFGLKDFFVIDPGTPHHEERLLLRRYIEQRQNLQHNFLGICLTHHHGDHTNAAFYLAELFDAPIFAHPQAFHHLKFPFTPLVDKQEIITDTTSFIALFTPGHAVDHVAFYDRKSGVLMAGDMITDRGTILIPPSNGSLQSYLDSLETLSRLYLTAIIPAHGSTILHEPNVFLIRAMKHRYERIRTIYTVIKEQGGKLDATDITNLVYGENLSENLFLYAQLSVESSLAWLKQMNLLENPHHYWQTTKAHEQDLPLLLLSRLEEINERLRNT